MLAVKRADLDATGSAQSAHSALRALTALTARPARCTMSAHPDVPLSARSAMAVMRKEGLLVYGRTVLEGQGRPWK